jgi:hypothetical protein
MGNLAVTNSVDVAVLEDIATGESLEIELAGRGEEAAQILRNQTNTLTRVGAYYGQAKHLSRVLAERDIVHRIEAQRPGSGTVFTLSYGGIDSE